MSALTNKTRADIPRVSVPPDQQVLGRDLAQLRDGVQKWGDLLPLAGCGFSAVALNPELFDSASSDVAILQFPNVTLDTHGWTKQVNTDSFGLQQAFVVPEGAGGVYVCTWQAQFVRRDGGTGFMYYGLRIKQSPRFPNRGGRNEWATFARFESDAPGDMQSRTSIETLYPGDMLWMEFFLSRTGGSTFLSSVDTPIPANPAVPEGLKFELRPGPSRGLQVWRIGEPRLPLDGKVRGEFTALAGLVEARAYLAYDTRDTNGSTALPNRGGLGPAGFSLALNAPGPARFAIASMTTNFSDIGGAPSTAPFCVAYMTGSMAAAGGNARLIGAVKHIASKNMYMADVNHQEAGGVITSLLWSVASASAPTLLQPSFFNNASLLSWPNTLIVISFNPSAGAAGTKIRVRNATTNVVVTDLTGDPHYSVFGTGIPIDLDSARATGTLTVSLGEQPAGGSVVNTKWNGGWYCGMWRFIPSDAEVEDLYQRLILP